MVRCDIKPLDVASLKFPSIALLKQRTIAVATSDEFMKEQRVEVSSLA